MAVVKFYSDDVSLNISLLSGVRKLNVYVRQQKNMENEFFNVSALQWQRTTVTAKKKRLNVFRLARKRSERCCDAFILSFDLPKKHKAPWKPPKLLWIIFTEYRGGGKILPFVPSLFQKINFDPTFYISHSKPRRHLYNCISVSI